MKTYTFTGTIHPARAQLSFEYRYEFTLDESGEKHRIHTSIRLNDLVVWVSSDKDWSIFDLRNVVLFSLRTHLSILGFLYGHLYTPEITRVVNREREIDYVFGVGIPVLEELMSEQPKDKYADILVNKTAGKHGVFVSRALNDLRMALADAEDTAFYCYRAIESLRNHYAAEKGQLDAIDKKKWRLFKDLIGMEKEELALVKKHADHLRHGKPAAVTGEIRAEIFKTTWNVVIAYVECGD